MKSIYDLVMETNESDVFTELAEQIYFRNYPEPCWSEFQSMFEQAVSGYYFIRDYGRSISSNNSNADVVVFCDYISFFFYRNKEEYRSFTCSWIDPWYEVNIIYPHRVEIDHIMFRKNGHLKMNRRNIVHPLDLYYIMGCGINHLVVPDSAVKRYGAEKVVASFLAIGFKILFSEKDYYELECGITFEDAPIGLAKIYFDMCEGIVEGMNLKSHKYRSSEKYRYLYDDALQEILHHKMMRRIEREYERL